MARMASQVTAASETAVTPIPIMPRTFLFATHRRHFDGKIDRYINAQELLYLLNIILNDGVANAVTKMSKRLFP
jgi:hypothetical protein